MKYRCKYDIKKDETICAEKDSIWNEWGFNKSDSYICLENRLKSQNGDITFRYLQIDKEIFKNYFEEVVI